MIEAKETLNVSINTSQSLNGNVNVGIQEYDLPIASENVLGGIKVGKNLTIDKDGTLNADVGSGGVVEESDPTVPAHVKAITEEQITKWDNGTGDVDLTDYAKKSEIPTKVSQLTNDKNYINQLKTINGNTLVGSGNIVIEGGSGGSSNVAVSPTEPTSGEKVWFQKSINLFDKNTITTQTSIKSDGTTTYTNQWAVSDWIKVTPNSKYTYQGVKTSGDGTIKRYCAYYDSSKIFVSSFFALTENTTITIPENVYYVRFSLYYASESNNDVNAFQFEEGEVANNYEPYTENKIYTLDKKNEYKEFNVIGGKELIRIGMTDKASATLTAAWQKHNVPFTIESAKIGSNLSITSNSKIKIGKGINQISIMGSVLVSSTVVSTLDARLRILRNGTQIEATGFYTHLDKEKDYRSSVLVNPLANVQEGDEVDLIITSDKVGTLSVAKEAFLYVEKVA